MRRSDEVFWIPEALAKIESRGISMQDVGEVLDFAYHESVSRSSGRPIRFGIVDGREIAVARSRSSSNGSSGTPSSWSRPSSGTEA